MKLTAWTDPPLAGCLWFPVMSDSEDQDSDEDRISTWAVAGAEFYYSIKWSDPVDHKRQVGTLTAAKIPGDREYQTDNFLVRCVVNFVL